MENFFDRTSVTAPANGPYPIITFPDVPKIDVVMLSRGRSRRLASRVRLLADAASLMPFSNGYRLAVSRTAVHAGAHLKGLPVGSRDCRGRLPAPPTCLSENGNPFSAHAACSLLRRAVRRRIGIGAAMLAVESHCTDRAAVCLGPMRPRRSPAATSRRARRLGAGYPHQRDGILNTGAADRDAVSAQSTYQHPHRCGNRKSSRGPYPAFARAMRLGNSIANGVSFIRSHIRTSPGPPDADLRRCRLC